MCLLGFVIIDELNCSSQSQRIEFTEIVALRISSSDLNSLVIELRISRSSLMCTEFG